MAAVVIPGLVAIIVLLLVQTRAVHPSLVDNDQLETKSQMPKSPSNDAFQIKIDPLFAKDTCNKSIVASHNMTEYWKSPQYDGGITNYDAETFTCQLTLTIPAETLYIVNLEMQSPSEVFETLGCIGDNLVYTSMGTSNSYCGDLSSMQWTEMQLYEAQPKTVTLTFMSKDSDGGVASGFNLKITAMEVASR